MPDELPKCRECPENANMKQFIEHANQKEKNMSAAIALLQHNIKVLEKKLEKNNNA